MTVNEKAYAKINLFLDVTGRRDDGFHDILSVMHSVSLCDEIILTAYASDKTSIIMTTNISDLSVGEDNLVYRAVETYLSTFGINANVTIHLEKSIPIGAGLGGGSTDGAAALRAMNKIFGLAGDDELLVISGELGSDLPFCLVGGTMICRGRGEKMTRPGKSPNLIFVIAIGDERVSTPKAYAALDMKYNNFAPASYIPKLNTDEMYNIFENVTKNEEIEEIKKLMIKNGAERTLMSGSGPSVFGVFADFCSASKAKEILSKNGFTAFVATSKV